MPLRTISTLKNWFTTGSKPLQAQFWDWLDSYWHKDEMIASSSVTGLDTLTTRVTNLETAAGGPITLTGTGSTILYQIPAGKFLEKCLIKSTSAMTFRVSLSPGANDVPVGQSLSANQLALLYLDLYADGAAKNVYFELLSGSVTIIIYQR